jgi:stress-induced-phosphoprotein 1
MKQKAKALAIKGNELAKQSEFERAIEKYSEAIRFDPSDHRLYVNRSYCYEKLSYFQEFEPFFSFSKVFQILNALETPSALNDADRAIILDPTWAKSYFRKGRALVGLKVRNQKSTPLDCISLKFVLCVP